MLFLARCSAGITNRTRAVDLDRAADVVECWIRSKAYYPECPDIRFCEGYLAPSILVHISIFVHNESRVNVIAVICQHDGSPSEKARRVNRLRRFTLDGLGPLG